jgi:hypothetical protein
MALPNAHASIGTASDEILMAAANAHWPRIDVASTNDGHSQRYRVH